MECDPINEEDLKRTVCGGQSKENNKKTTEKREEHQAARTCIRCIGNQPVISCHVSLHSFPGCCKQGSLEFNNRYLSLKDNKALPFNSTKKNM